MPIQNSYRERGLGIKSHKRPSFQAGLLAYSTHPSVERLSQEDGLEFQARQVRAT